MAIRVIIERRVRLGHRAEVGALLIALRAKALTQPGYLSGETLVSMEDALHLVVISRWEDVERWEAWKRNPERTEVTSRIRPLLEGSPKEAVFMEGTPGHEAGP